jgi:hypothetical protein
MEWTAKFFIIRDEARCLTSTLEEVPQSFGTIGEG